MTTYQIPVADQAPTGNLGSVQIQKAGRIKRIDFALAGQPDTNGLGAIFLQVTKNQNTFNSVSGIVGNAIICATAKVQNFSDVATQSFASLQAFDDRIDVDYPVALGDLVQLNATNNNVPNTNLTGFLLVHVAD